MAQRTTTKRRQPMRPEIVLVRPHRLGGLDVWARYACGHKQENWFPQASRRTSKRTLHEWVFGYSGQEDKCPVCTREELEAMQ